MLLRQFNHLRLINVAEETVQDITKNQHYKLIPLSRQHSVSYCYLIYSVAEVLYSGSLGGRAVCSQLSGRCCKSIESDNGDWVLVLGIASASVRAVIMAGFFVT